MYKIFYKLVRSIYSSEGTKTKESFGTLYLKKEKKIFVV